MDAGDFVDYVARMVEFDRQPCGTAGKPHVALVFARWMCDLARREGVDITEFDICARCYAPHPHQEI
jgi:hypothetical protein